MGAESYGCRVEADRVIEGRESGGGVPVTPDGRYFVVRGRLWRCSNPALTEAARALLVGELMAARRAKGAAMRAGDAEARRLAKEAVEAAKQRLGERGPVWWDDGAPDWNRHMARSTPYAGWYEGVTGAEAG